MENEFLNHYIGTMFLEKLQREQVKDSKVLIIAASADDYEKNDDVCECYRKAFEIEQLRQNSGYVCDLEVYNDLFKMWDAL